MADEPEQTLQLQPVELSFAQMNQLDAAMAQHGVIFFDRVDNELGQTTAIRWQGNVLPGTVRATVQARGINTA